MLMLLKKNFDTWNKRKKVIHEAQTQRRFQEGEIWWCAAGLNIGHEIDGKNETYERPFYILKKCSRGMCIGVPCTSTQKSGSFIYVLKTFNLSL